MTTQKVRSAPDFTAVGGFIFMGVGVAVAIGGSVLAVDDPAGFILVAFGLIFAAAGFFGWRMFRTPKGKRAITVGGFEAPIHGVGGAGMRQQSYTMYVDESASEEEVDAAKRDWVRKQFERRSDWVTGRIVAEDKRKLSRGLYVVAAILIAAAVALAGSWGYPAMLLALPVSLIGIALIARAMLGTLRQRKFGQSILVLQRTPAHLGESLCMQLESGIRHGMNTPKGFTARLRCVHRWQETRWNSSTKNHTTVYHRDALWEQVQHVPDNNVTHGANLSARLEFQLPPDKPATTLVAASEGITWELEVTAEMAGVDYSERFEIPVLQK